MRLISLKYPLFHPHVKYAVSVFNLLVRVYTVFQCNVVYYVFTRKKVQNVHPHIKNWRCTFTLKGYRLLM